MSKCTTIAYVLVNYLVLDAVLGILTSLRQYLLSALNHSFIKLSPFFHGECPDTDPKQFVYQEYERMAANTVKLLITGNCVHTCIQYNLGK